MTLPKRNSVKKTLEMLNQKEISAVELVQEHLNKAKTSELNAYITICEETAIEQAKESQHRIDKGIAGKLDGIPLGIKDLFCTKGVKTTAASKMLANYIPHFESDVTQKLFSQGGIMIGKTNMDEFAMGSTNLTSYFGACINPIRSTKNPEKALVPGGSSGGSAAAVAGGLCLAATGSDTGGSIRQPASFCGVVGVKPSYGVCSRYGMVAFASSLDQAGFFANTVDDAAYLMEIISGSTGNDSMLHANQSYDFTSNINNGVNGLKIGIPKQFQSDHLMPEIKQAWQDSIKLMEKAGATIIEIDLPTIEKSINVYYIIAPAEASSNLSRFDGIRYGHKYDQQDIKDIQEYYIKTRTTGFGEEVKRRILIGNYILSSEHYDASYVKAMKVRRLIKQELDASFQNVDAILCPATPNVAFGINDTIEDPKQIYLNDIYTVPVNLAGLPAMSVPCGFSSDGLPIGMQIITNYMQDSLMYQVAKSLENAAGI